jgi:hypothetical protein
MEPRLSAAIVLATGFTVGLTTQIRAEGERPAIAVMLQNEAMVPADVLTDARIEVTRLFGLIGIGIEWLEAVPPLYQRFRVVSLTTWEPSAKRIGSSVLGYTQTAPGKRGVRAYVFWRRVERASQTFTASLDKVLAVAIAHEIGHMFLPNGKHAKTGLMRAPWDSNHFRSASAGLLTFSDDSAIRIRRRAEAEQVALTVLKSPAR